MSLASEQLEEGEIIDDDDFEEISDNSITDFTIGKFVPPNENLRALSLSSDSEVDIKLTTTTVTKSKKKLQHRRCKHHKKRRHIKSESTDSDFSSDLSEKISIKGKLKEAVHIDEIEMGQKRSLEARLKAMGGLPPDSIPTPQPSPPSLSNSDELDKIDDSELEKLRIEALKTTFLNKNQQRKKRKALETQQVQPASEVLDNKENNTPEQQTEKLAADLDEDEDLLRASLLAGLAKKMTKTPLPAIQVAPTPAPAQKKIVQPNKKFAGIPVVTAAVQPKRIQPQVKPLIIKLNGDSDSSDDEEEEAADGKAKINEISSTVEQFLKEQRAKFETDAKKNTNTEILTPNNNKTQTKDILEKSAVKLLPKSQQIEYQQLLKKLKNAEKQNKLKKLQKKATVVVEKVILPKVAQQHDTSAGATKLPEAKAVVVVNSEVLQSEKTAKTASPSVVVKEKDLENEILSMRSEIEAEKKRTRLTHELTTLRRTLREVRTQRNGSLQIKMRYQVLTPIMKKITEASQERKKHEERIRALLQQLNESRANLAKSHDQFSMLVKELTDKKQIIDRSSGEKKPAPAPVQKNTTNNSHNGSNRNSLLGFSKNAVTSTPLKANELPVAVEECSLPVNTQQQNNRYDEDMDVCNSDDMDMCQIEIVDPNDIDQIFRRRPPPPPLPSKSTMPDYVSPLNLNASRYNNVDPLGIMCPYEVNGSCRDLDCSFKHYLKH